MYSFREEKDHFWIVLAMPEDPETCENNDRHLVVVPTIRDALLMISFLNGGPGRLDDIAWAKKYEK